MKGKFLKGGAAGVVVAISMLGAVEASAKAAIHVFNCSSPELTTGFVDDDQNQGAFEVLSYNLTDHLRISSYDEAYPSAYTEWKEVRCHSAAACQIHVFAGKGELKLSRVDNGTRMKMCQKLRDPGTIYHSTDGTCPSECAEET